MTLSNNALASGEATALSASAKSRVPASITVCPGRNLRVAGLGVCSVRISMPAMWRCDRLRSSTERRSPGDDPAGDGEGDREADQRSPPFAGPHRLGARRELGATGDHRHGQLLTAKEPVVEDCGDVQDHEA